MIRTDVVELDFIGDGQTQSFDAQIEGIPREPEGRDNFAVTVFGADGELDRVLVYGVDYRYETVFDPRGFPASITLALAQPLPVGERLVIVRTTPIVNLSAYPDRGVHPRQVEGEFDHIIKILQEHDFKIRKWEEALAKEMEERKKADEDLQDAIDAETKARIEADEELRAQIDNKMDKDSGAPAHAIQHRKGAFDQLLPVDIGALEYAPNTGKPYLAVTNDAIGGWMEYIEGKGGIAAATVMHSVSFTADGIQTSYSIAHTMQTRNVEAVVYDADTNLRVGFGVRTPDDSTVILYSTSPPASGRKFRVLIYGPGKIDPAWMRTNHVHTQATPATVWTINHNLHNPYPWVLVLDDDKNEMVGSIDWATATADSIRILFYEAVSGTAIAGGWAEK